MAWHAVLYEVKKNNTDLSRRCTRWWAFFFDGETKKTTEQCHCIPRHTHPRVSRGRGTFSVLRIRFADPCSHILVVNCCYATRAKPKKAGRKENRANHRNEKKNAPHQEILPLVLFQPGVGVRDALAEHAAALARYNTAAATTDESVAVLFFSG